MKKISGPSLLSILWNTRKFRRDPIAFGVELLRKYGNVLKLNIWPFRIVVLNDPAYHHWVLKENFENYVKGKAYEKLEPLFGQGLLITENKYWRQNRANVNPVFRLKNMEIYFEDISVRTHRVLSDWEPKTRIDFHQEMMNLTLSIIVKTLFNVDFGSDSEKLSHAIHDYMAGMENQIFQISKLQQYLPTRVNRNFKAAVKFLNGAIDQVINDRRNGQGDERSDMINLLLKAEKGGGPQGITKRYLRDEVMNFVVGGHETTANALSWCMSDILKYPETREKILAEIRETIGSRDLTLADLERFPYLDQVINESLRMNPPLWIMSRETLNDDVIDGYPISKGTIVVVSSFFLHHREDIWPEAETFDPGRFTEEEIRKRPKNSFLPFGLGPRACIGEMLGRMEIKAVLIMVLQKFELSLNREVPVERFATVTLRPKNGVSVNLQRRTT